VLFPVITRYEAARAAGEACPAPPFRTVQNPIRAIMREHEAAGEALAAMRRVSDQYAVPADGCNTCRARFDGFSRLEADLHRHIHLENNILFPRAVSLEASFE